MQLSFKWGERSREAAKAAHRKGLRKEWKYRRSMKDPSFCKNTKSDMRFMSNTGCVNPKVISRGCSSDGRALA